MKGICVVTRSFQGGSTFARFDNTKCTLGVIEPLKKLLSTAPDLGGVVVVGCGDSSTRFGEEVIDGLTPTLAFIAKSFPAEVGSGKIILKVCSQWGLNAGSATALNEGIRIATTLHAKDVLMWSPEIDLSGHMIHGMSTHKQRYGLQLCGYLRNRWWQKIQWMFAQNTCALWDMDLLESIGGMNPECNGDGVTEISTLEFGNVPLAGMEDIEAYFRATKLQGSFVRWGCFGQQKPAVWNLALKKPGSAEYDDNLKKVARQGMVMDMYSRRYFETEEPFEVYEKMMQFASFG